ncbi:hypothetical protein Lal_00042158 [Lupinus albus]|nr:hypothetical protein Lal_00042158 [Lupinus albus]
MHMGRPFSGFKCPRVKKACQIDILGLVKVEQDKFLLLFAFTMLESAINYGHAFNSFSLYDANFMWYTSENEWNRAEIICEFLRPFNNITKLIYGSYYPTSNLYLAEIWTIECLLKSILTNEDLMIQQMARNMKLYDIWGNS